MKRVRRVHLVGIGGAGMSGIAEILLASGYAVSGSDLRESETTGRLRLLGAQVVIGHAEENVGDADVVVHSSAVSAANRELAAAAQRHIPVIPRAEMLGELMRMKFGVAVAGSHGKTTTTSLVGAVLQAGGLDPTTIVGGRVKSLGRHSQLGAGDILVAEADESDGSFLRLMPTVVVITNVDREHLDHWGDFERLRQGFLDFANRVPFWGLAILCLDDPAVQTLIGEVTRRSRTYGLSAQAEVSAEGIALEGLGSRFRARAGRTALGEFRLPLVGVHNVQNALAAIAVGLEFDVAPSRMQDALAGFRGVERRFELLGEHDGVLVVDDYAHHPAEIRATLAAARQSLGRRIVVAFQPHRYTRTHDLFEELARAFHDADALLLTEIYAAGEAKIPGVDGALLAERVRECGHRSVRFVPESDGLIAALREEVRPGDAVLFMGAGDITRLGPRFLAQLRGGSDDR
jgi:UDP-N-acetylmuramate--alanine ligase